MSRSIATIGIAVVVAVSFLFVGVGAVAAHDGGTDVGASGNCDDANNGGGGSVGVGGEDTVDATGPDEIQSTVQGLAWYAQQRPGDSSGDACDGGDESGEDNSYDYIEAHAGPGQFCFSQQNNEQQGDVTLDGSDACGDH